MPLDDSLRELRIGGSEISAIFGRNEYLDEFGLWARKKGNLPPQESAPRMRLGKHLEQGIVSYAAEIAGWEYEWCDQTSRSEQYPFMAGTPDALMPKLRWGIDAKLVGWDQAHRWGRNVNQIPHHAVMQAWWYIAQFGYLGWYVVALVMGEDQPRIYPVPRDLGVESIMLRKAEAWWKRYLIGDERPTITASDHSDAWLKKHHPRPVRPDIQRATPEESEVLDEYADIRSNYLFFEKKRLDLEAQIKAAIGDRAGLEWPGGKFTWKLTKESELVDWPALGKSLIDRHPAKDTLLTEFTYIKPGHRRIYFKSARTGAEMELV